MFSLLNLFAVFAVFVQLFVSTVDADGDQQDLEIVYCPDDIQVLLSTCNKVETVVVSWSAPKASNVSTPVQVATNIEPGHAFPVGETTEVEYRFDDAEGNTVACEFQVDVIREFGECHIWGDPHYLTFDGRRHNFQGGCEYTLAETCSSSRDLPQFSLTGINVPHPANPSVSMMRGVRLNYQGHEYSFRRKEVTVDGVQITLPLIEYNGVSVSSQFPNYVLETDFGLIVKFDQRHESQILISSLFSGVICGLCGDFDGDEGNDFQKPDGSQTRSWTEFGNAWALPNMSCRDVENLESPCTEEPDVQTRAQELCSPLAKDNEIFLDCHAMVDTDPYHLACMYDVCALPSASDLNCDSFDEYALACNQAGGYPGDWRSHVPDCALKCPEGMTYTSCGSACQPTCAQVSPAPCQDDCIETCICPEGQVIDGDRCVSLHECGCLTDDGIYIKNGENFTDGNCEKTCSCVNGEITCETIQCHFAADCSIVNGVASCACLPGYAGNGQICELDLGVCRIWGDPHYLTFDSRKHNFQGNCEYTLVKTCTTPADLPDFHITGRNVKPKPDTRVSYIREVHVIIDGQKYSFVKKGRKVLLNRAKISLPLLNHHGVSIFYSHPHLILETSFGLIVRFTQKSEAEILLPKAYASHVCGLCGNFDGKIPNDFKKPDGRKASRVVEFGNAWSVSDTEECLPFAGPTPSPCSGRYSMAADARQLCSALDSTQSSVFAPCFEVVDSDVFYNYCVFDLCASLPNVTVMCDSFNEYEVACKEAGIDIGDWRSTKPLCSRICPEGMEYTTCGSACPETCANLLSGTTPSCTLQCIDSCACPAGQVLDGENCVEPEMCGCLMNNGVYLTEGESSVSDNCTQHCTCQRREIFCEEISCDINAECAIENDVRNCFCNQGFAGDGTFCEKVLHEITIEECPKDMDVFLPEGVSGTNVDWIEPTAHTEFGPVTIYSQTHTPNTYLEEGITMVTYEFRDVSGSEASCSFQIDMIVTGSGRLPLPATLMLPSGLNIYQCPHDMTIFTATSSTPVTWEHPTASSSNGMVTLVQRTHKPGDAMDVGTTQVVYTFKDDANIEASCSFLVHVVQGVPSSRKPIALYSCPNDMTFNLQKGEDYVVANWNDPMVGSDNGPVKIVSQSHQSGDHMTVGVTTVAYRFQDEMGVTTECSFDVTVLEAGGVCEVWGDPHYLTFDGRQHNFQGDCEYILVKTCDPSGNLPDFQVIGDNQKIRQTARVSYLRKIRLIYNSNEFEMRKGGKIFLNGVRVTLPLSNLDGVSIFMSVPYVILETDFGLVINYNRRSMAEISLPSNFAGRVCGLCGNFDKNKRNDLQLPDGTRARSVAVFGNAWNVLGDSCDRTEEGEADPCSEHSSMQEAARDLCKPLSSESGVFSSCYNVVDPASYYEACMFDVCAIQRDLTMVCESFQEYATACADADADVTDWTSEVPLCALRCPVGMEFKRCTTGCPATCANPTPQSTCPFNCIDACVCPHGQVLDGENCVTLDQCGCAMDNGLYLSDGGEYVTDNCSHTCWCMNSQLICNEMSCSQNAMCEVVEGQRTCVCKRGFSGNGYSCIIDILPGARPPPRIDHPITVHNCPYDMILTIPDEKDVVLATWIEPTTESFSGQVALVNQTIRPGTMLSRGIHDVWYVYELEQSDHYMKAVCHFQIVVTSGVGLIDSSCRLPGGEQIQTGQTFISDGCSTSCSCSMGSLICNPYGCGKFEVCGAIDGLRKCVCNDGFSLEDGVCKRDCPPGFIPFESSCYYFTSEKKSFNDARDYCEGREAYLAAIASEEENKFVTDMAGNSQGFWIGGQFNSSLEPDSYTSIAGREFQFIQTPVTYGSSVIRFSLQTGGIAYIALSAEPKVLSSMYIIALGEGGQNDTSSIRLCRTCPALITAATPNLLSEEKEIYLRVSGRSIEVGLSGKEAFLRWVDQSKYPLPCRYVGIASDRAAGSWRFHRQLLWLNDEPWLYENWQNGSYDISSVEEDTLCVEVSSICEKYWELSTCSNERMFICEM